MRRDDYSCHSICNYFLIDLNLSYEFLNLLIVVDCLMGRGRLFQE